MLSSQLRNVAAGRVAFAKTVKHQVGRFALGTPAKSFATQLEQGEYLEDEAGQVFLNETVASYSGHRRIRRPNGQTIDELFQVELTKETRMESSQKVDQAATAFPVNFDKSTEDDKGHPEHLSLNNSDFLKIRKAV